ncbi:hypothetical protein CVD28_02415 [Bacillus sp. M6-12]|uniref:hypothetical protein n=1 Tax=Bacillus sp. M6-12 TaxID=2054166 RepID=UPI000C78255F|nr:hypothetical protein [Bacillus sp. M6-12]PLS19286.1 hypothetical protein CVD28_02415 [Bacillus sp. M6-12]
MATVGTYTMNVNRVGKTIDMTVSGTFTPEKAQAFIKDYQAKVGSIKADEFVLKFDCRDLEIVTQEMIPNLENCFKMYMASGFKKVEVGIQKKPIIKMQLSRLARNVGLTNLEVLEIY